MHRFRLPRLTSAHALAFIALVLAVVAPASAALVTARGIANNAVLSQHIKNGTITSADLGINSVTTRQIKAGSINGTKLRAGSVGTNQIADDSIGAADIANGAITGAAVADGSLTAADLAPGTIPAMPIVPVELVPGAITSAMIADGAVTSAKIADGAVTSAKIADGAVTSADIADGGIATADLANGSVTAAQLAAVAGASIATAAAQSIPNDPVDFGSELAYTNEEGDGTLVTFTGGSTAFAGTGMVDLVGAPTRVTITQSGLYQVTSNIVWTQQNTSYRELQIVANSDGTAGSGTIVANARAQTPASALIRTNQNATGLVKLIAGDRVGVRVAQNSGGALDLVRANLSIVRIGSSPS